MEDKLTELKLILEAGENAKEAAFAYFAVDLIGMVLLFTGFMVVVAAVYKLFRQAIELDNKSDELEQLANVLGTKSPGHFTADEQKLTLHELHKLAQAQAEKDRTKTDAS